MTSDTWERFILLADRAGKFMTLFTECQPHMQEFRATGFMDPGMAEKVDYCLRGLEHFAPFLDKFTAFLRAMDETPMELVDPDVLAFIDSL